MEKGIHLATMGFGGSEGSYIQIGNQKSTELNRAVSLNSVNVGLEFDTMLPIPGNLINYAGSENGPVVLLKDGTVVKKSHDGKRSWEFNDEIARIVARENDGIYFPSDFGDGSIFGFKNLVRAIDRSRSNVLKDPHKSESMVELYHKMMVPGSRNDLAMEARYLDEISIVKSERGDSYWSVSGEVHRRNGEEDDTRFGSGRDTYGIRLHVSTNGFGWYHLQVPERKLSTGVEVNGAFDNKSDEAEIMREFVRGLNEGADGKYRFDIDFGDDKEGYIRVASFSMESPCSYSSYDGNKNLEKDVLQTHEMLSEFQQPAEKLFAGIKRAKAYRESQAQEAYRETANRMGL